jgi:hypothetical protein
MSLFPESTMSPRIRFRRGRAGFAAAGFGLLCALASLTADSAPAQTATAGPSYSGVVTVPEAVDRTCFDRSVEGAAGASSIELTPPLQSASLATLEARLTGPAGGDWDIAVFDQGGNVVAASAGTGASEVASGFVLDPGPLTIQACRISGDGADAQLAVRMAAVNETGAAGRDSLAFVKTPRRTDFATLEALGLDLTEHGGEGYVAVVLHGAADRAALERAGLEYTVEVRNLAQQSERQRAADARYAADTQRSALPSGRDTYRRLFEYEQELKDLADDNPEIARTITLPHESWEGRSVQGIEITTDVDNRRDGKPVFLMLGLHHAREWPSGEHTMEWAYQMIKGYNNNNQRVVDIVENLRTIVVPVVNADGFNNSREVGELQGGGGGRDGNDAAIPNGNIIMHPYEYRRKNCRFADDSEGGSCTQPAAGLAALGVDPNRNYGAFWGGLGASGDPTSETYYGPGPFSEPDTQNVRELVSERQVTVLITNHTFSDLVLRAPGLASEPDPIDEPAMKALGDAMAAQNGYLSQHGYELYDTTGTTEDWSYNTTGGFGYTFEIGCNDPTGGYNCTGNFHPTYPKVVDEWKGTTPQATPLGGKGNQEAYFIAAEAAATASQHSMLQGKAPPGAILKLSKTVETPTSQDFTFTDHLDTELKVPDSGDYDWHINPSTRPLVAQDRGRLPHGSPSADIDLSGEPGPSAVPGGNAESTDEINFNDHPFTIPGGPGVDNDTATVTASWPTPASDWDMYVVRDTNGDGSSVLPDGPDEGTEPDSEPVVGSSPTGSNPEITTFARPEGADGSLEPGAYVVRMVNFAAVEPYDIKITFAGPTDFVPATTETWRFSCTYVGETRVERDILINRGESQKLDLAACGLPGGGTGGGGDGGGGGGGGGSSANRCGGEKATLVGSKAADKMVGTDDRDVIVGLGGNDKIDGGGGDDVICAKGGDDRVTGGPGDDQVRSGGGRDRARGRGGADNLRGGGRPDRLYGGGGADTLLGGGGRDRLNGGAGKDRCGGRRDRISNC